jgi:hypothetical protein
MPMMPQHSVSKAVPAAGLALLLIALAPAVSPAQSPSGSEPVATADPADPPGTTTFTPTRQRTVATFRTLLRDVEQRHAAALAAARVRLAESPRHERPAIQREIEALKSNRQLELLQLQLDRARAGGRVDLARRIEQRLAQGAREAAAGGAR